MYSCHNLGVSKTTWHKRTIESLVDVASKQDWDNFHGNYGGKESQLLYDTIKAGNVSVKHKSVLVIGSIQPWVESIFLSLGANHTTTLEYNKIMTDHPQVISQIIFSANYALIFYTSTAIMN